MLLEIVGAEIIAIELWFIGVMLWELLGKEYCMLRHPIKNLKRWLRDA